LHNPTLSPALSLRERGNDVVALSLRERGNDVAALSHTCA